MANLTFAQDFTSSVELDSSLIGVPLSGLFYNRGVHPLVTIDNLLNHLPYNTFTLTAYSASTTYAKFEDSRSKTDIVTYNSKVWESLVSSNLNHTPAAGTYWRETNIDSLRLRSFIWSVEDNVKSELYLSRSLIESQYIYNVGKTARTLSGDYIGWAFEPKNSDYVKIKINQICLQATTISTVSLFVINQGILKDTLTLTPVNGILQFEDLNYTISGKGVFYFVFANREVLAEAAYNDALKFDSFVAYPVTGSGTTKETIDYVQSNFSNGFNFNVSCYLDSDVYIDSNLEFLAKFTQCQFEMDAIQLFINNPSANINPSERNTADRLGMLATEKLDIQLNTVARKYQAEKKKAIQAIEKTFDNFIKPSTQISIKQDI